MKVDPHIAEKVGTLVAVRFSHSVKAGNWWELSYYSSWNSSEILRASNILLSRQAPVRFHVDHFSKILSDNSSALSESRRTHLVALYVLIHTVIAVYPYVTS